MPVGTVEHVFDGVELRVNRTALDGAQTPCAEGLDADKERLMTTVPEQRHPALEVSGGAA
jgi:hypothetical protein